MMMMMNNHWNGEPLEWWTIASEFGSWEDPAEPWVSREKPRYWIEDLWETSTLISIRKPVWVRTKLKIMGLVLRGNAGKPMSFHIIAQELSCTCPRVPFMSFVEKIFWGYPCELDSGAKCCCVILYTHMDIYIYNYIYTHWYALVCEMWTNDQQNIMKYRVLIEAKMLMHKPTLVHNTQILSRLSSMSSMDGNSGFINAGRSTSYRMMFPATDHGFLPEMPRFPSGVKLLSPHRCSTSSC